MEQTISQYIRYNVKNKNYTLEIRDAENVNDQNSKTLHIILMNRNRYFFICLDHSLSFYSNSP